MTLGTVLVVEDNPITRKLVKASLTLEGYEVLEAETGHEALEQVRRKAPHVVLQDIGLADVDGFDLVGEVRRTSSDTPPRVIAFTGLTDEERIRSAGFDDLLVKPVSPSRLLQAVRIHVEARQTQVSPAPQASYSHPPPRDRLWRALPTMLGRLAELAGAASSDPEVVREVLTAFLDASGFFAGAAYVSARRGGLRLRAQFGFRSGSSAGVPTFWQQLELLEDIIGRGCPVGLTQSNSSVRERALLERAGLCSLMIVPLSVRGSVLGALVLGSANQELPADWLELAQVVAGPIAQTIILARTVARLTASEHKFRGIAECTADGIIVTGAAGTVTYANPAAERLIGLASSQLVGREIDSIHPLLGFHDSQTTVARSDGTTALLAVSVRTFEDPPGRTNRVYVLRDLSESIRLVELARLADHDALTGLMNRRRFEEELTSRLAESRRYGTGGALVLLDLDRFKEINDRFGHQAGDAVLQAMGDVLRRNTRESDFPARLGGDEFVLLLNHTDAEGARACAAKISERIASTIVSYGERGLSVAASAGIAVFPSDGAVLDELLGAADAALYRAKHLGGGRVENYAHYDGRSSGSVLVAEPSRVLNERADNPGR